MVTAIKNQLYTNWHPLRFVALFIAVMFTWNAFTHDSGMAAVLAIFFAFQAVTNTGCLVGSCAGGSCNPIVKEDTSQKISDVHFEEIQEKKQ